MAPAWRDLPALELGGPVLSVARAAGDVWAGGLGGVVRVPERGARTGDGLPPLGEQNAAVPLTAVVAVAADGATVLAGGAEGVAWSDDAGRTWRRGELQGGTLAVTAIALAPGAGPGVALAGTLGAGVLRTTDSGRHWASSSFGIEDVDVPGLLVVGDVVLAATSAGVARSTNGGRAWRSAAGAGHPAAALAEGPGGLLVAALEDGRLLGSRDEGASWHLLARVDGQPTAVAVPAEGLLLVATSDRGLLRSQDGGATFAGVAGPTVLGFAKGAPISDRGAPELLAAAWTGLLHSRDLGETWEDRPVPGTGDAAVLLAAADAVVAVGPRSGVSVLPLTGGSRDWRRLPGGPVPVTAVAVTADGSVLASGPQGLARHPVAAAGLQGAAATGEQPWWEPVVPGPDGYAGTITVGPDGTAWAAPATTGEFLLRSADAGRTWERVPAPFGVRPVTVLHATADGLFAAAHDPRHLSTRVWHSPDGYDGWSTPAQADTAWPHVVLGGDPVLLGLGRVLHGAAAVPDRPAGPRDGAASASARWRGGTDLGAGIAAVAPCPGGPVVLTAAGLRRLRPDGGIDVLDDGLPAGSVRSLVVLPDPQGPPGRSRLLALLAGGRLVERDLNTA